MSEGINYFEHFYQQASQDPDLLERNVADYPYSSLAGFLLLCHYKKINHPGFEKLAKRTVLHFKNSNWLQFLLDQASNETGGPAVTTVKLSEELPQEVKALSLPEDEKTSYAQKYRDDTLEVLENKPSHDEKPGLPEHGDDVKPEIGATILQEQNIQNEHEEITQPAAGGIAFEPLHTVDYFASQGIKITEEPITTDKLGNQMKSFTAWLKSMKRLHPSNPGDQDAATEKLIQSAAEESNINTEVLTEAMAEVLIKQDKREKAIEMYSKLSLINPSKSAYFAAKIERIKST